MGFPGVSEVKNPPANAGDSGSSPGLGRSPEEEWHPTLVFLPGKFHGQKSLVGFSPWGCKQLDIDIHTSLVAQRVKHLLAMRDTRVQSLGQEEPL